MKRVSWMLALSSLILFCAPVASFAQARRGNQPHAPAAHGQPQMGGQQQRGFGPGQGSQGGYRGVPQGVPPRGLPQNPNPAGGFRNEPPVRTYPPTGIQQPGFGQRPGAGDYRGTPQRGLPPSGVNRGVPPGGANRGLPPNGVSQLPGRQYRPPVDPSGRGRIGQAPANFHVPAMRPDQFNHADRARVPYRGGWDYGRYGCDRYDGYYYGGAFFDFAIIGGPYSYGFFAGTGFVPSPYIFVLEYGRWYRPGYNGYVTAAPYQYGYMGPITIMVVENVYVGDDAYGNPIFQPESFAYTAMPYPSPYGGYTYGYYDYAGNFHEVY